MKSLENRTRDSKREMKNDAALDELMSMKSMQANVSDDDKWKASEREHTAAVKEKSIQEEEDEATLKSVVFHNSKDYVRR